MSNRVRRWVSFLVLVGLASAGASTYMHVELIRDPHYTSFCDVNATISCTQVYLSRFGSINDVPIALAGVLWFALVGLLVLADARTSGESRQNVSGYLLVWSTLGLAVAIYMAYASFFVLRTFCMLCGIVYVSVIGIFLLVGSVDAPPATRIPVALWRDTRRLASRPVALGLSIIYMLGAVASVAWFPRPGSLSASATAVETAEPSSEAQSEFERFWAAQPRVSFSVSGETAKVVVVKFNDYQCPACAQTYLAYQPVFAKYTSSHPGSVRVVTMDYPLDPECNDQSPNGPHTASCEASVAVRLAADVGSGEAKRMERWLFSNQETMTAETIKTALLDIAGITPDEFDARYDATIVQVKEDITAGGLVPVEATPTFVINGVTLKGGLDPQYFDQAIAYELARAEGAL